MLEILTKVDKEEFITSSFFLRPENIFINSKNEIKIRFLDDHFFTERLEKNFPLFTHVFNFYDN